MNLYQVNTNITPSSVTGQVDYSMFYVVADGYDAARDKVCEYLKEHQLGGIHRSVESINLVIMSIVHTDPSVL